MRDKNPTETYRHLVDVIQQLSLAKTLDDITTIVRRAARSLTGADGATFVLRDNDLCFYADEDAIAPLWKGKRFPMKTCISGWVMLNREPVTIHDIYKDDRIPHDAYRPTFVKSLTMVPIRKEAPIGAIGIYWSDYHTPAPNEVDLLQALADSTSISLQNLNLYRELQNRVEDLDKSNRIKDEFLMSMSHELRTPLNAISGWSSILESGKMNAIDAASAGKTIFRNAKALGTIVDDLLDVAQIMAGQIQLDQKPVDTARILSASVDSMSLTAAEKDVRIFLDVPEDITARIHADEDRLLQILGNLLSNAVKFSQPGGMVRLSCASAGPSILFKVSDHGIGIGADELPKVFDKFWQADSTTTRRFGGLGLGLAIAKELAEAHGGTISASSAGKDKGASFVLSLPISGAAGYGKSREQNDRLKGLKILAVDDHDDALELLSVILKMYGANVVAASGAVAALDHLKSTRFDVIVSDLSMPEKDGFSLISSIRQESIYPEGPLPAVALTAFADKATKKKAMNSGFNAFLGKPLQPEVLAKTIAECLG